MRAWYFDETSNDPRDLCVLNDRFITQEILDGLNVECLTFDADNYENDKDYNQFKIDRNYNYQDIITVSKDTIPDYDEKVKSFLREHIHDDEETRAIADGSGFFDVRDKNDEWIRIEVSKGDLLVIPAGIYHRFIPTKTDFIKAIRLFVGNPVWTPINRDSDEKAIAQSEIRQKYLASIVK